MSQFPIFKSNRRRLKKNSKTLRIRLYFPGAKSWYRINRSTPESFPNQFSPGSRTVHSQFEERHVTLCGLAQHRDVFVQDNRKERSMPGIERMNDAQEPKTQRELEALWKSITGTITCILEPEKRGDSQPPPSFYHRCKTFPPPPPPLCTIRGHLEIVKTIANLAQRSTRSVVVVA